MFSKIQFWSLVSLILFLIGSLSISYGVETLSVIRAIMNFIVAVLFVMFLVIIAEKIAE